VDENLADQLSDNFSYNKNLQPLAVQLRKNATKSEACLWKYALKSKQMQGYAFRRQRPVLQYIADFLCKELMLIIELDGITHDNEIANVRDKHREEQLTRAGFKIVRFTDKDVLNNMAGVILKLEKIISDIEASTPLIPRQRGTTALSSAGAESGEFPRGVLRHAPGKLRDGGGKLATLKNVKTL
jgi:very-short-patch-repair endonuclease